MQELNESLYALVGKARLSADDLGLLASALTSKWYPVQVVAAKVLVRFHPPEARALLTAWLQRHVDHDQMCREAQKALVPCITEEDLSWILELYLRNRDRFKDFLIAALILFPSRDISARLVEDCHRDEGGWSVVVLSAVDVDREAIFERLLNDPGVPNKGFVKRAAAWEPVTRDQMLGFKKRV